MGRALGIYQAQMELLSLGSSPSRFPLLFLPLVWLGPNALCPFRATFIKAVKSSEFLCPESLPTQLHSMSLYGQPDVGYAEMRFVSVHNQRNTLPFPGPLPDVYDKPVKSQGLHSTMCPQVYHAIKQNTKIFINASKPKSRNLYSNTEAVQLTSQHTVLKQENKMLH